VRRLLYLFAIDRSASTTRLERLELDSQLLVLAAHL
jgi:hypothetical protein